MILTGGKRSSAVLAACEKRRSGLAPSTTQGPGTKTESSIFGMPTQQVPPGSFPHRPLVAWAGLLARRITLGGRGLAFGQSPDHLSGNSKNQKKIKSQRSSKQAATVHTAKADMEAALGF